MGFGQCVIERQRLLHHPHRDGQRLGQRDIAVSAITVRHQVGNQRFLRQGRCIQRIDFECSLQHVIGFAHPVDVARVDSLPRQQVKLVGLRIGRRDTLRAGADDFSQQCIADCPGDLILHCEYVVEVAIESFRVNVKSVARLDELRRYPNPLTGLAYRPLENVSDIKQFADFAQICLLAFESK